MAKTVIEYKVRPVVRYIVTKFVTHPPGCGGTDEGSSVVGEFPREEVAEKIAVGLALADEESDRKFQEHLNSICLTPKTGPQ